MSGRNRGVHEIRFASGSRTHVDIDSVLDHGATHVIFAEIGMLGIVETSAETHGRERGSDELLERLGIEMEAVTAIPERGRRDQTHLIVVTLRRSEVAIGLKREGVRIGVSDRELHTLPERDGMEIRATVGEHAAVVERSRDAEALERHDQAEIVARQMAIILAQKGT